MALLYGRTGRLTAQNGGFWPGQEGLFRAQTAPGGGPAGLAPLGTQASHGRCCHFHAAALYTSLVLLHTTNMGRVNVVTARG
jgi:hypothetical protein